MQLHTCLWCIGLCSFSILHSIAGTLDCKYSKEGKEYNGKVSQTKSGKTCQRWDKQTPHSHSNQHIQNFPDATLAETSNYCRNPDNEEQGPWCYTMDPNTRWEYCDVSFCECRTNRVGKNYGGRASKTVTQKMCQRWDSQTPHQHTRNNPRNFPEDRIVDAANYCRNPDNEPRGPWCYTTNPSSRWEYCDIAPCECKETTLGKTYYGKISQTRNAKTCQRWDSQSPHRHNNNNPRNFPEDNVSDAANYCRNPDNEPNGPWCYTTDSNTRWDYCDIPYCFFYKPPPPTPPPVARVKECKYTRKGEEFKGTTSVTNTAISCQRWDTQRPHRHTKEDPDMFPDRTLTEAENYCRNPDGEPDGPWCYTTDPDIRWQYCNISMCDCKDTKMGRNYQGKISQTKGGIKCQRWDSQSPHTHTYTDPSDYPDPTLAEAANHCRNPDKESDGPWCYTTQASPRWDYCEISFCECKMDEEGGGYSGHINQTMSKIPCQRWDKQYPNRHPLFDPNNFPEKNITLANNYCRNPDGESSGPWCYTLDTHVRWQYCDVPYCKTAVRPHHPPPPPTEGSGDCVRSRMGFEYNGNVSVTHSGNTCQRWDSQTPHEHHMTDVSMFPEKRVADASNYCRNPDASPLGPWCFTTNPTVRWEYCAIPQCDCKYTSSGQDYMDRAAVTQSGRTCQRWDAMTPHKHQVFKDSDFPDKTVSAANNYCRNPKSAEEPLGPWCFTMDPNVPWEYCLILDCECKKTELGETYQGRIDYTRSGRRCQRWDSQYPHSHSNSDPSNFPDKSVSEASNYCRNPDGEPEGPWCYTMDKAVRWEFCDVEPCPIVPNVTVTSPEAQKGSKLGAGGIAGISLGVIAFVAGAVLVAIGVLLWGRRRPPPPSAGHPSGFSNPDYKDSSSSQA